MPLNGNPWPKRKEIAKTNNMRKSKELLSTLWVFVTLNYLYCDVMGLMDSNLLNQYLTGSVDGLELSESFLFYASILMEIPILMVVMSKVLPIKWNAWTNIIAAAIKTLAVLASLFVGSFTSYYFFFASIEICTTVFIIIYSVLWLRIYKV